jgi:hypothetical protein
MDTGRIGAGKFLRQHQGNWLGLPCAIPVTKRLLLIEVFYWPHLLERKEKDMLTNAKGR